MQLNDGWLATKDLATFDENRFAFIGRKDNLFISGGENVCPESVEQKFTNSLLINNIVILPKAHHYWGMQTVAVIEIKKGTDLQKLVAFSKQYLLPHEQPRHYYVWQRQDGLKVQRAKLIQQVKLNDLEELT